MICGLSNFHYETIITQYTIYTYVGMTQSVKNIPETCWEFMECPIKTRDKCLAYKLQMGKECWFVWHINKDSVAGRIGDGCFNCPWFNRNNPLTNALKIFK